MSCNWKGVNTRNLTREGFWDIDSFLETSCGVGITAFAGEMDAMARRRPRRRHRLAKSFDEWEGVSHIAKCRSFRAPLNYYVSVPIPKTSHRPCTRITVFGHHSSRGALELM